MYVTGPHPPRHSLEGLAMVGIRTGLGVSLLVVAVLSCEDPLCACSDPLPPVATVELSADSLFFSTLAASQTISATARDSTGSALPLAPEWTTSDTTIAFSFTTDGQTATVVSVRPGVTAVTADFGSATGSAIVVVDTLP